MAIGRDSRTVTSFGRGRRWLRRLNIAACVVLTLYILVPLNVIVYRHPLRLDLTQERLYSLSSATLSRLELVSEEIRVVFPFFVERENLVQVAHYRVLERARTLLDQYAIAQPLIKVVAEVSVYSEPDRWKQVSDDFDLSPIQWNRLIFFSGEGNNFRQTLTPQDLASFTPVATAGPRPCIV